MNYPSRQSVRLAITIARESLISEFVPNYLRFQSPAIHDREDFIRLHVTDFSNTLYNPEPEIRRAILYPDCTYIKAPKSSHFRIQRQSYSLHKHYTLFKAGLIVASDGYILDVHGPSFDIWGIPKTM